MAGLPATDAAATTEMRAVQTVLGRVRGRPAAARGTSERAGRMSGARESVRVRVTGRVQGVWFRGWTAEEARARGLSGWVRNEDDGTVAALLSGPADRVRDMVAALHGGPPLARVDAVAEEPAEVPREPGFHVLK